MYRQGFIILILYAALIVITAIISIEISTILDNDADLKNIYTALKKFLKKLNEHIKTNNLEYLLISASSILMLIILSIRNEQLRKQSETQYKIFTGEREFDNFLNATKILTG